MDLVDVANSYLTDAAVGAKTTVTAKAYDIRTFLNYMARRFHTYEVECSQWTPAVTQAFIDDCLARGEAQATVARRLSTIRHMARLKLIEEMGMRNPTRGVKAPQLPQSKPKRLTPEEVARVLDVACAYGRSAFTRARSCFIVTLLLETGLRASEILSPTMRQLAEDFSTINHIRCKGGKIRSIRLISRVRDPLERYLSVRAQRLTALGVEPSDGRYPIIINTTGRAGHPQTFRLCYKSLWVTLANIGKLAGTSHVHAHRFRHTFGFEICDIAGVRVACDALGHSDIKTTMRYTTSSEAQILSAQESISRG